MKRARSLGIDAFALNIGVDPYTDQQLQLAYASAAQNSMKVFISFDFNWWHPDQVQQIGQKIAQYASLSAQLMVDNKIFVSTFSGDNLDVNALRAAVGKPIFFAPNFHPSYGTNIAHVDGLLNWMAWPNNGQNKAPTSSQNVSVADGDRVYINALGGKAYIARQSPNITRGTKTVSPWFFTHFGPEVSYSKNWVFPSDLLWYDRWNEILGLGPRFVEIVTWNDYGESHYIGPLQSRHTDDGASKWVNDMPHDGWLDLSKPFIEAFKAGASSITSYIKSDQLIYWYRPAPRDVNCDSTDTCMVPANNASGNYFLGRPDGWQSMEDSVFVVSLLTAPASVHVNSGGTVYTYDVPAGASARAIPMSIGVQSYSVSRNGQTILSGTSLKPIINSCVCGLYNFNAYGESILKSIVVATLRETLGTLPAGFSDPLQADGLASFRQGLHVQTCEASPSLGTVPPTTTITSTTTISGSTTSATSITTSSSTSSSTSSTTGCQAYTSTITQAFTATVTQTMTQTQTITVSATSSSTGGGGAGGNDICTGGTGSGNYLGLCVFCCQFGYCPPGPCTCTQYGARIPAPPSTGIRGVPLPGEDASYSGLCSFACDHGYCPSTACATA
ncbi:Mutanase [Penicillium rolfsii]|nr:Mutanase [Penicillium rolfsii]